MAAGWSRWIVACKITLLELTTLAGNQVKVADADVAPPAATGSGGRGMWRESAAAANERKCGEPCAGLPSGASTTKLRRTASGTLAGLAELAPSTRRVAKRKASSPELSCSSCLTSSQTKPA